MICSSVRLRPALEKQAVLLGDRMTDWWRERRFCIDEGNSSSRKTRQQVAHAQSLLWQAELAQVEEAMRLNWPPLGQSPTLSLVSQVQEKNRPGYRQNAHVETFGKKGKERIQRGMQARRFPEEKEQTGLNVFKSASLTTQQMRQHA